METTAAPTTRKQAFAITEAAAARIRELMAAKATPAAALLVSVKSKGCSGLSYHMELVDTLPRGAETVTEHGVTVAIDPMASMYLFGTVMDYHADPLKSAFEFKNPNETGRCGCGESFTVKT